MAEIQKRPRSRRNTLGAPPSPEETRGNLMEPEVAPAPMSVTPHVSVAPEPAPAPASAVAATPAFQVVPESVPEALPVEPVAVEIDEERPKRAGRSRRASREDVMDGRTLRKTGRTEQFSTRVHPDFKKRLYKLAKQTGKNYNVILEESLDLYLERMGQGEVA